MRKFLLSLMMASAMVPAAAVARDRDGRAEREPRSEASEQAAPSRNGSQRSEAREERQARPERAQRVDNVDRADRGTRERRFERQSQQVEQVQVREGGGQADAAPRVIRARRGSFLGGVVEAGRQEQIRNGQTPVVIQREADGSWSRDGRRDRDGDWSTDGRRDRDGSWTRDGRRDRDGNVSTDGRRDRDGSWSRDGRRDTRWSSHWRGDRRYDWRNHRERNRSIFRIGRYYDPYGWGYRRFSIGFNLWPSYYSSNYWLNDPWMYRLPPAYGPYRWVRYYDDALLVNIYTGQVVDVINNFFW